MRFQLKNMLCPLFLGISALPWSGLTAQEKGGIVQHAAAPDFAATSDDSERAPSSRQSSRWSAKAISYAWIESMQQPPIPDPPAPIGPTRLPGEATAPSSGPPKASDAVGSPSRERSLTPLQSRVLSIDVKVVDLTMEGLGTGVLPEPAAARATEPMTSGYARGGTFQWVYWHPSGICHYPLRFEEAMLERHGHVRFGCLQPLVSGARFFGSIPMWPYFNTLQPAREPVYAFGHFRPGSRAPLLRENLPWDRRAAVVETLTLAGFFWAAPL